MTAQIRPISTRFCIIIAFFCLMTVSVLMVYITPSVSIENIVNTINIGTSSFSKLKEPSLDQKPMKESLTTISEMLTLKGVNCSAIFVGSQNETSAAQNKSKNIDQPIVDQFYLNATTDCVNFQSQRGYIMSTLTEEEENFPIAYSLIVYKDSEMVERLLRAIYRPQNIYCIHIDKKSTATFYSAISGIANCFTNVFLTSRRIDVQWGTFTVLEPELLCMEELWRYPKWKYFINLTGQEFPLKTNFELVKILTAYNGAQDVISTVIRANRDRWKNTLPPNGLVPVKGQVHIVVQRNFVDFILHNKTASSILNWTKTTVIPDETYFAILNSNPKLGLKGTYKGEIDGPKRSCFVRYKNWGGIPCAWKRVRQICILTTGDLPLLVASPQMFANKFFLNEDRVVIGCLEEKIFNDTRDEYIGTKTFNDSIYVNADFVKNQVT